MACITGELQISDAQWEPSGTCDTCGSFRKDSSCTLATLKISAEASKCFICKLLLEGILCFLPALENDVVWGNRITKSQDGNRTIGYSNRFSMEDVDVSVELSDDRLERIQIMRKDVIDDSGEKVFILHGAFILEFVRTSGIQSTLRRAQTDLTCGRKVHTSI